jgi:sigma-B regulation protein RsbU (phosphoserine phosphatase)
MTSSEITSTDATSPAQALSCLEVWGGNETVDTHLTVPGLAVAVYAAPLGDAAGGDVHFVSSCGSGRIARLMVADVAGHGPAVAETARTLRSLIRRYMNHIDQRLLFTSMNDAFAHLAADGQFATAVVLTYFSPDSELAISNAGHPPPLLYRAGARTWEYLTAERPTDVASSEEILPDNTPLGVLDHAAYGQMEIVMDHGDIILCYTDSLMEAKRPDGKLLGLKRMLELIRTIPMEQPDQIIPQFLKLILAEGVAVDDDVTLLAARSTGPSKGAPLIKQLGATRRFFAGLACGQPDTPWPELSVKNLSGGIFKGRKAKR